MHHDPIKFLTKSIESSLCDYSDAYISVTGDIAVTKTIAVAAESNYPQSDNYSDSLGSLWGFKRDEVTNNADMNNDNNAPSFKYKASVIDNTEAFGTKNGVKIAVPLKVFE